MTAQLMPTIVVSKLVATVGRETEKIRLEVPAKKFPSAALMSSSQLVRGPMRQWLERGKKLFTSRARTQPAPVQLSRSTSAFLTAECKTQARLRLLHGKSLLPQSQFCVVDEFSA